MGSNDRKPLLGDEKDDYGAFAVRGGYSASPRGLASIVSEHQSGALAAFGGAGGILKAIAPGASLKGGLGAADARRLADRYGENGLPPPPRPDLLGLVATAAADPTMAMLAGGAVVSLAFGDDWIEGVSIGLTICLVVGIAALTDYGKANEFRKQQLELEGGKTVNVVRGGGSDVVLHPGKLVVGDVVRLAVGDIAPADGVLIQGSSDLKMDESALTGETRLIGKSAWSAGGKKGGDGPFIVSGTNVMQGTGLFLVLAVGNNSIQGKILSRIREQEDEEDDEGGAGDGEAGPGGCGAAIRSFFTFGGGDDGAHLMEKLDILAVDIGKMGTIVAVLVFMIMFVRFVYAEFFSGTTCLLPDEQSCLAQLGCRFSEKGGCTRYVEWEGDIAAVNEFFMTAITILVVAVPEGLPLAVTLALAVSGKRMTRDNNQVKHIDSTETMGSATTICSDKTGTLTENKMTVMKASFAGEVHEHIVGETGSESSLGSIMNQKLGGGPKSKVLAEAILVNVAPTSKVTKKPSGEYQYEGNPTDCALVKLAAQLGFDAGEVRAPFQSQESMLDWGTHNVPFSSERKRMSWIVPGGTPGCLPYGGKFRLYCKGAPQQVFDACGKIVTGIGVAGVPEAVKFSDRKKHDVMDLIAKWQANGLRTLAIAFRDIKEEPGNGWDSAEDLESNMTLLAVVGIEDPLRASVPGAIQECAKAGIDIRMCTGDALPTAIAIAKGCKILKPRDLDGSGAPKEGFAMTGAEFDDRVHKKDPTKPKVVRRVFDPEINDAVDRLAEPFFLDESGNKVLNQGEFDKLWPTLRVLARCQPEDKLTLVRGMRKSRVFLDEARCAELLNKHGIRIFPDFQVVAVTGDGTNDAPALKSANVGFAMGIAGTETAKQACDIILLDDNFSSIVKAVMWGRNVFDCISKFIQFQLTVNVVAITLAVVGAFTYDESPLTPVQMLWVNMIMDSLASLALATEQPTRELLDRMPYGKRRPVVSPVMIANIVGHSVYQIAILFWVLFAPGTLPIDPPVQFEPHKGSLNWSVFFNVFVFLQLFNEFNARRLPTPEKLRTTWSEWNIFQGVLTNPMFICIMAGSFAFQVFLVQYVGAPVSIVTGGLSASQWIFCVVAGAGSLVMQFVINAMVIAFVPDSTIHATKKPDPEEIETAVLEEPPECNWSKVKLGVRRAVVYSKVFNMSFRSGYAIEKLAHSPRSTVQSEESYRMMGKQMLLGSAFGGSTDSLAYSLASGGSPK